MWKTLWKVWKTHACRRFFHFLGGNFAPPVESFPHNKADKAFCQPCNAMKICGKIANISRGIYKMRSRRKNGAKMLQKYILAAGDRAKNVVAFLSMSGYNETNDMLGVCARPGARPVCRKRIWRYVICW